MKYSTITDGLWIETMGGIMALTDKQKRAYGFLAPIGNQILGRDIQSLIQAHRRLEDDKKNKEQLQDSSSESN